jgi:O-antigen/teichoic acid export membrane protein
MLTEVLETFSKRMALKILFFSVPYCLVELFLTFPITINRFLVFNFLSPSRLKGENEMNERINCILHMHLGCWNMAAKCN